VLDHIVYAVPDLEAAVAEIAGAWGVLATPGGQHVGRGTRNALIALGDARYLEVIGPDPEQPQPAGPRPFGIDRLAGPRLVTWAVKAPDIDARVERAKASGYDAGPIRAMSRARPDGVLLSWRLTQPAEPAGDGLVPFLIDWGVTPHPSATSASGCRLVDLRGEHPQPAAVQTMLKAVGVELTVQRGPAPALMATIETPNGVMELR
jgi:hypothetical protein